MSINQSIHLFVQHTFVYIYIYSESYKYRLSFLLKKWNLEAKAIPIDDFFPEEKIDLLQNKTIQLYEIRRAKTSK